MRADNYTGAQGTPLCPHRTSCSCTRETASACHYIIKLASSLSVSARGDATAIYTLLWATEEGGKKQTTSQRWHRQKSPNVVEKDPRDTDRESVAQGEKVTRQTDREGRRGEVGGGWGGWNNQGGRERGKTLRGRANTEAIPPSSECEARSFHWRSRLSWQQQVQVVLSSTSASGWIQLRSPNRSADTKSEGAKERCSGHFSGLKNKSGGKKVQKKERRKKRERVFHCNRGWMEHVSWRLGGWNSGNICWLTFHDSRYSCKKRNMHILQPYCINRWVCLPVCVLCSSFVWLLMAGPHLFTAYTINTVYFRLVTVAIHWLNY